MLPQKVLEERQITYAFNCMKCVRKLLKYIQVIIWSMAKRYLNVRDFRDFINFITED